MADRFDASDFDSPPPKGNPASDPGADYRPLLDAMRKAGAEGVAQQTAALARQIAQDAQHRIEWASQIGGTISTLQRATAHLQQVSAGVRRDRLKEWVWAALIGLGLILAAALAYHWAQTPKIEDHYFACERVIVKGDAVEHFKRCLPLNDDPTAN